VVSVTGAAGTATAQCPSGKATGGGGMDNANNKNLKASQPVNATGAVITSGQPTGWKAVGDSTGDSVTAYAICAP
jgi:hypothetical protein